MPYNRSQTFTATTTFGDSWNADPSIVPFDLSIRCTVTGTVDYKLQYTLDPCTVSDAAATWVDSTDIPAGTTATDSTVITSPVERVRLVIASNTGAIKMQMLQGMSVN